MSANKSGHIKETIDDKNGYRQFVINCIGINDQRKYFSISPFGIDFNPPANTRALATNSANKDQSYNIGVLNKIKIDDLGPGESAIFSTNESGTELGGFIKLRSDGTTEQNGDTDFIAGFTGLKEGFDTLRTDLNNLITAYNAHIHTTTATVGATPTPGIISPTTSTGTPSSASIDDSRKDNLKIE